MIQNCIASLPGSCCFPRHSLPGTLTVVAAAGRGRAECMSLKELLEDVLYISRRGGKPPSAADSYSSPTPTHTHAHTPASPRGVRDDGSGSNTGRGRGLGQRQHSGPATGGTASRSKSASLDEGEDSAAALITSADLLDPGASIFLPAGSRRGRRSRGGGEKGGEEQEEEEGGGEEVKRMGPRAHIQ